MADTNQPANKKMTRERISKLFNTIQRISWGALLIALPVTSFPFFPPAIGGEALVRPLSLYPLILLVFLVILPRLLNRPIPKTLLSLMPFVLVAVASSLLSLLRGIEPVFGITVSARVIRGMFTLAIGCAFYFTIALLPKNIDDLRFSLRWIYTGCILALFWGSLQALHIASPEIGWLDFLDKAQSFISIRRLHTDRIVGLTYEPHWFAEQIILLIVPWSLAAVLTGYSVFRWHWRRLTIECLLLGCSILILPFTYSRSGLMSLVILILMGVLLFRPKREPESNAIPPENKSEYPIKHTAIRRALEISLVILIVLGPIYIIGSKNTFFARLWKYWQERNTTLSGYISSLGFDARLIYGQAALKTYETFPLLGVGLGNYAFYFEEMLPYRPVAEVPEILLMITPESGRDRLITSKNLYLRLLAETGIIGASTFLAFIIANLGCALYLWFSPSTECKYWGRACLLGLIAFALSALTFDSFVVPNPWVVFGLITSTAHVITRSSRF
jgi:O-antigen ligase